METTWSKSQLSPTSKEDTGLFEAVRNSGVFVPNITKPAEPPTQIIYSWIDLLTVYPPQPRSEAQKSTSEKYS